MISHYRHLYFSFVLFSASVFSQTEAFMAPLAAESVLLDIAKVGIDATDSYAVAVGERGHILVAIGNSDFVQVPSPTQSTLTAVAMIDNHIWAVGHDAVIVHSADRGQNWELQFSAPELDRPFLDITFFDEKHGIAIGAYGLFYRTEDGGKTWQAERHAELLDPLDQEYLEEIRLESEQYYIQELDSILPHLNRITMVKNVLVLVGESGLIAISDDEGKSWQRKTIDYYGSFFDVIALTGNEQGFVVVGLRGNAFYSVKGEDWTAIQTCTNTTLNSIIQLNQQSLLAVGNNGVLLQWQLPISSLTKLPQNECGNIPVLTVTQTEDKSAVMAVAAVANKLVAVTANGFLPLTLR